MNLNYEKRDGTKLTPALVLVDSGDQTDMVYGKTGDFLHKYMPPVINFIIVSMIAKFVDKGKEER